MTGASSADLGYAQRILSARQAHFWLTGRLAEGSGFSQNRRTAGCVAVYDIRTEDNSCQCPASEAAVNLAVRLTFSPDISGRYGVVSSCPRKPQVSLGPVPLRADLAPEYVLYCTGSVRGAAMVQKCLREITRAACHLVTSRKYEPQRTRRSSSLPSRSGLDGR